MTLYLHPLDNMKQHNLLAQLEKTHDNVFQISVMFREREVTVSERNGLWEYGVDYDIFQAVPVEKLAKEILYAYANRK